MNVSITSNIFKNFTAQFYKYNITYTFVNPKSIFARYKIIVT